jgi:hypothetical protein
MHMRNDFFNVLVKRRIIALLTRFQMYSIIKEQNGKRLYRMVKFYQINRRFTTLFYFVYSLFIYFFCYLFVTVL